MKTCVGIRTYRWGDEEQRLFDALHPVLGDDLVAVVQNPGAEFSAPADVVPLTTDWIEEQGLRKVSDWGWRCGDYAYYALRGARPDYDFYWLVEPDVYFSTSPAPFFAAYEGDTTDLLALDIETYPRDHRFARGMPDIPLYRAIFALTRISGRTLDRMFALRKAARDANVQRRDYPNDELFLISNTIADPSLSTGNLRDVAPDWFDGSSFETDPDLLVDRLEAGDALPGRVYHPARSRSEYRRSLASRLSNRVGFLRNMTDTLAHFDDGDIDDVVSQAGANLRRHLRSARRSGWNEARQKK